MTRHTVLLTILLTAYALPGHAQGVQWATDLEDARREARERNVPLMLMVHRDDKFGCCWQKTVLAQGTFAKKVNASMVAVFAQSERGKTRKLAMVDPTTRKKALTECHERLKISTESHRKTFSQAQDEGLLAGLTFTPATFFYAPDGRVLMNATAVHKRCPKPCASTMGKLVKEVCAQVKGPSLSRASYGGIQKRLAKAMKGVTRNRYRSAFKTLKAYAKNKRLPQPIRERMTEELAQLDIKALDVVEKAAEAGDRKLLTALKRELAGRNGGKAAAEALAGAK